MKKQLTIVVLLILSVGCVVSVCFAIHERNLRLRYRSELVHLQMRYQMNMIEARALHFMQLKLDKNSIGDMSRSRSHCKKYEIALGIPPENAEEFREWMRPARMEPIQVDAWPDDGHGASYGGSEGKLYYRVYYGQEPKEWK